MSWFLLLSLNFPLSMLNIIQFSSEDMACIICQHQKIAWKKNPCFPSVCKNCIIHNIECIPHQFQQGKRTDINCCSKRSQYSKRWCGRTKKSKYSTSSEHINSEESDFSTPLMQTSSRKIWQVPNANRRNQTRKPRSTRLYKSHSWCWGCRGSKTVWPAGCHGFSPCSKINFSNESQEWL